MDYSIIKEKNIYNKTTNCSFSLTRLIGLGFEYKSKLQDTIIVIHHQVYLALRKDTRIAIHHKQQEHSRNLRCNTQHLQYVLRMVVMRDGTGCVELPQPIEASLIGVGLGVRGWTLLACITCWLHTAL